MINKIFPRILNASKDARVRGKTEMKDALNVRVGGTYDNSGADSVDIPDQDSDSGVLKPVPGNQGILSAGEFFDLDRDDVDRRVVGTVVDNRNDTIYFFVYSNASNEVESLSIPEMGVYAYDGSGFFGALGTYTRIYRTREFQFKSDSRVVGTVVHVSEALSDTEFGFRPMLYFTDGENEPRRLDVIEAWDAGGSANSAGYGQFEGNLFDKDVITACVKAPIYPPEFEFSFEESRSASDFRRVPGVQFAYQCVYAGGEVSAISTYSDIAIPDEYLRLSVVNNGSVDLPQRCQVRIYSSRGGALNHSNRVVAYKVLVRRGNTGAFYEVDEIPNATGNRTDYDFYNDKVLSALTEAEENKQYEGMPRAAEAIAAAENRLFFGNYTDGYDRHDIDCVITVRGFEGSEVGDILEIPARAIVVPMRPSTPLDETGRVPSAPIQERGVGLFINTSGIGQGGADALPPNVFITVSVTFEPAAGFGLYTAKKGLHNARFFGEAGFYQTQEFSEVIDSDYKPDIIDGTPGGPVSGWETKLGTNGIPGRGYGSLGVGADLEWHVTSPVGNIPSATYPVCVGTSAHAALRIKGAPMTFSCELITTTDITNTSALVASAIGAALGGEPEAMPEGLALLSSNVFNTYSYNLGFADPTGDERFLIKSTNSTISIVPGRNSDEEKLDLITPVHPKFEDDASAAANPTAVGYVIVNEATVTTRLVHHPLVTATGGVDPDTGEPFAQPFGSAPRGCLLTLEVDSLSNLDVRTCIPIVTAPDLHINCWRVYSASYLEAFDPVDITVTQSELNSSRLNINTNEKAKVFSAVFHDFAGGYNAVVNNAGLRKSCIGYLRNLGGSSPGVSGNNLYVSNSVRRANEFVPVGNVSETTNRANRNAIGTSIYDLEGAWRAERAITESVAVGTASTLGGFFDDILEALGGDPANPNQVYCHFFQNGYKNEGAVSSEMVMSGIFLLPEFNITRQMTMLDVNTSPPADFAVNNIFLRNLWRTTSLMEAFSGNITNFHMIVQSLSPYSEKKTIRIEGKTFRSIGADYRSMARYVSSDGGTESSQAEIIFNGYLQESASQGSGYRSFKTSAFHDFALVYYDDRGRPGPITLLPRVYIPGYSAEQRQLLDENVGERGRIDIKFDISGQTPPAWAHQYQLLYAGNTTYSDFVQYSIGGAFIDERGSTGSSANRPIYLSLNYLQTNKQVSYTEAFGAYHPDGTKQMYTFAPGDQLRVLFYQDENGQSVYPNNVVFDIIDQVLLTGNTEQAPEESLNPLDSDASDTPEFLKGSFIVVRDNVDADGFNWQAVSRQGNDFSRATEQSNWNKNCVVELLRPRDLVDAEDRAYQETGLVYNVRRGSGTQGDITGLAHQTTIFYFDRGDVWWRRVPVNLSRYDEGFYDTLIPEKLDEPQEGEIQLQQVNYQPRFRAVYLECRAFTDTFPGTNVNGYGKRKFYFSDAKAVRRDSSITYSDQNTYSNKRLFYGSFNPYQMPFVDLPNQYGAINALVPFDEYLLVLQEDKASIVPINRSILSDASGGNQLIRSDQVVGKQKFISGEYGTDGHRESVVKIGEDVYFAHPSKGEIYRYRGGKIEVISRKGLGSQLQYLFRQNKAIELANQGPLRVVSGYDPMHDEYVVSIFNQEVLAPVAYTPFTQPALSPGDTDDPSTGVEGTTFEDLGGPPDTVIPQEASDDEFASGGNGFEPDFGDPITDGVDESIDVGGETPPANPDPVGEDFTPFDPETEISSDSGSVDTLNDVVIELDNFTDGVPPPPGVGDDGIVSTSGGFPPFDPTGAADDLASVTDSTPQVGTYSLSGVVPSWIPNVLLSSGEFPDSIILIQNRDTQADDVINNIQWNLTTNTIQRANVGISWSDYTATVFSNTDVTEIIANPASYADRIAKFGNGQYNYSIAGIALLARNYFSDRKTEKIHTLKTGGIDFGEMKVVSYSTAIRDSYMVPLTDALEQTGLLNDSTSQVLLDQAYGALDALEFKIGTELGGVTAALAADPIFLDFIDPNYASRITGQKLEDIPVFGFSAFSQEDYPLDDAKIFQLNSVKTLVAQISDIVTPLETLILNGTANAVANLAQTNATLRAQLDVLTSQVQNLSSAPTVSYGGAPLVQDVTINQDQTRARQIYAGADGQITELDIVRTPDLSVQINNELTVLLDSFSSQGVEVTGELVRELLRRLQLQNKNRAELSVGGTSPISGDPYVTDTDLYFVTTNTDEGLNLFQKSQIYRADQNDDGLVTAADFIQLLSAFGTSGLQVSNASEYIFYTDLIAQQYNNDNA